MNVCESFEWWNLHYKPETLNHAVKRCWNKKSDVDWWTGYSAVSWVGWGWVVLVRGGVAWRGVALDWSVVLAFCDFGFNQVQLVSVGCLFVQLG